MGISFVFETQMSGTNSNAGDARPKFNINTTFKVPEAEAKCFDIDIDENIILLHIRICRYNFDIPYSYIEHIRTYPQYSGLYQLMEMILASRIGCAPDKPIIMESDNLILQLFARFYNMTSSIFMSEERAAITHDLLNIVNDELDRQDNEPNRELVLMLLHDKLFGSLFFKPIYNIIHDVACHDIDQEIDIKNNSKEELESKLQDAKAKNQHFPKDYINFMDEKNRLIKNDASIPEIMASTNILFPQNIHPLLKKYKNIMEMFIEAKRVSQMRIAKKFEYAHYVFISAPAEDYQKLHQHILTSARLCFEADTTDCQDKYIEYLSELITAGSDLINISTISEYFTLLYNAKRYKDIYSAFIINHKSIICEMDRSFIQGDSALSIMYLTLMAALLTNKTRVLMGCFTVIIDKYKNAITNPKCINLYSKILYLMDKVAARETFIKRIGYNIQETSTIGEPCVVCYEEVEATDYQMVVCPSCHHEIGHIGCVERWLAQKASCPRCRYVRPA